MAQFTFAELEWLWIHAKGSQVQAPTAAGIALAESNGCSFALAGPIDVRGTTECSYRYTTEEDSRGLWQINLQAHPEWETATLFLATVNAEAAVAISRGGTNFGPWTTYRNGAYRERIPSPIPRPDEPNIDVLSEWAPYPVPGPDLDNFPTLHQSWDRLARQMSHTMPRQLRRALRNRRRLMRAVK